MPNAITSTEAHYRDQLSRDERFIRRVQQHLMNQALVVLAEAGTVPNHQTRVALAQQVVNTPEPLARRAAFVLVHTAGLTGKTTIADGSVSTAATDAEILSQLAASWDLLSGVTT